MSIGLIDQDCLNNKKDFFYDLDIMKLASYYKSKKEITKLLLIPSEYTQYTKTFFIKNRFDYKLFDQLFKDPRIVYRGYAFSADCYEPLENDIEKAPADVSIYDTYLKFNENLALRREDKVKTNAIREACHSRLSINGTSCNVEDKYIIYKESNTLCLYDYNMFALIDWRERMKDFNKYLLRFKFSPITNNIEDLKEILCNYKVYNENHFILGGNLSSDIIQEVIALGKIYKDRIRVELLYDLNFYNKEIFYSQIIYALNTILALKNAKVRTHAYIDTKNINEKTAFLNTIAYWSNRNHSDASFNDFLINIRKQGTATKGFNKMAEENDIIKYLLNVIPSEWRSVILL